MAAARGFPWFGGLGSLTTAGLILFGCGGGGSDGAAPVSSTSTISGAVVKGPVSGATVKAFAISGGAIGPVIATGTTNAQGDFSLSTADYSGPVMLQTSGGAYVDEATGTTMTMGAVDMMTAVIPAVAAGSSLSGIEVTPVTSMAQAMAMGMAGRMTDANITAANMALGRYFMVSDILRTPPMNPLVPGSGATASQATMNYGMVLAAMSQYAKNAGMTTSSGLVTAMMNDVSDGVMDGLSSGVQVGMGGGMMGTSMMQPDAGRTGLATAMADFMNSSANKSGLSTTNMSALMQQLMTADGHMH